MIRLQGKALSRAMICLQGKALTRAMICLQGNALTRAMICLQGNALTRVMTLLQDKALTRARIINPFFLAHFSLFFSHSLFRPFPYSDSKIRLGAHARNSTSFVNGE
eukprot:sb/3477730/